MFFSCDARGPIIALICANEIGVSLRPLHINRPHKMTCVFVFWKPIGELCHLTRILCVPNRPSLTSCTGDSTFAPRVLYRVLMTGWGQGHTPDHSLHTGQSASRLSLKTGAPAGISGLPRSGSVRKHQAIRYGKRGTDAAGQWTALRVQESESPVPDYTLGCNEIVVMMMIALYHNGIL